MSEIQVDIDDPTANVDELEESKSLTDTSDDVNASSDDDSPDDDSQEDESDDGNRRKDYVPPTEAEEEVRKYTLEKCASKREFNDSYLCSSSEEEIEIEKCHFPELPFDYTQAGGGIDEQLPVVGSVVENQELTGNADISAAEKMELPLEDRRIIDEIEDPNSERHYMDTDRSGVIESQLDKAHPVLSESEVMKRLDKPPEAMLECRPKQLEKFVVEDESFFAEETETTEDDADDEDGSGKCGSRACPKFGPPKIPVKENIVSAFRFFHSRRPIGTRLYFRPENGRKKPPYVPTDKGGCFRE